MALIRPIPNKGSKIMVETITKSGATLTLSHAPKTFVSCFATSGGWQGGTLIVGGSNSYFGYASSISSGSAGTLSLSDNVLSFVGGTNVTEVTGFTVVYDYD